MTGSVAARIDTPSGAILIGGKGRNTYQLDQMRDVAVVIDLGGGNVYYEGTVGPERPVLIVINLEGNNIFRGSRPGIQGGAVLGVSMLLNLGGNNTYEALDVAQGSALAGVGILIDYGSNNRYRGVRRVQGTGPRRPGHPHRPRRKERLSCRHVGPRNGRPAGVRFVGQRHRQ